MIATLPWSEVEAVSGAPRERRPNLPALTGLRYLAAAAVVIHHFYEPLLGSGTVRLAAPVANLLLEIGYAAVGFFFVLSGFILVYSDLDGSGRMVKTLRGFWMARFARIYPVYLVAFLLDAPFVYLELSGHHQGRGLYTRLALYGPAALLLLQAWTPWTALSWNGPGWSLSAEAFFYSLYPALTRLGRLAGRTLLLLILACWIASSAPDLLLHLRFPPYGIPSSLGMVARFNPLLRLPEFAGGMALAMLYLRQRARGAALGVAASCLTLMSAAALIPALLYGNDAIYRLLQFPINLGLIYSIAHQGSPITRALGEASYSIYILHIPLLAVFMRLGGKALLTRQGAAVGSTIFLILTTAIGLLSFRFVEHPCVLWLRGRTKV